MKWGNFKINKIEKSESTITLEAEYLKEDTDFKGTKKLCWLDSKSPLTLVNLVEYDNILITPKFDDDPKIKMEDICNKNSKFSTLCYAEPHIKTIDLRTSF